MPTLEARKASKQVVDQVLTIYEAYVRIWCSVRETNGRNRKRLISYQEVLEVLVTALKNGAAYKHGGHVANAYGNSAGATILLIRVRGGKVYWHTRRASATKGSTGVGLLARAFTTWSTWDGETYCPQLPESFDLQVARDIAEDAGEAEDCEVLHQALVQFGHALAA